MPSLLSYFRISCIHFFLQIPAWLRNSLHSSLASYVPSLEIFHFSISSQVALPYCCFFLLFCSLFFIVVILSWDFIIYPFIHYWHCLIFDWNLCTAGANTSLDDGGVPGPAPVTDANVVETLLNEWPNESSSDGLHGLNTSLPRDHKPQSDDQ